MARLLILCSRTPYPLTDGAKIRMYNTAKILSQYYTVDLLIIDEEDDLQEEMQILTSHFNRVTLFTYPKHRFYFNTLRGLVSYRPLQTFYFSFNDVHHWLEKHHHEYDLFYCNHLRTTQYVRQFSTPKVVDLIDAMSRGYAKAAKGATGIWRVLYPIESTRLFKYEQQILRDFDHVFIVSSIDKKYLLSGKNPSPSLSVVPNGVKDYLLDYRSTHTNEDASSSEKNWLVFLGSMKYTPNIDAVTYFAKNIFPKIRERHPHIQFLIVGKSPTRQVQRLGKKQGIHITGFVDDPAEYLLQARIVVAPMRHGTGIHNKILEALSLGKPVVTTPVGTEGLSVRDGIHLRVTNCTEEFITTINTLLASRQERNQLGKNGRQLIKRKYTWDVQKPLIVRPIQEVLAES